MTHMYFWRNGFKEQSPERSLHAITAVNMGDRPSACIAQVCLPKSAESFQEEYPQAAEIITKNSHMDDIVSSSNNREEAESRSKEIDEMLLDNGFRIEGWLKSGEGNPGLKKRRCKKVQDTCWG